MQSDLADVGEELEEAHYEIEQAHHEIEQAHHKIDQVHQKLVRSKNDRVVNTHHKKDRNCFVLCKLNEDPADYPDDEIPYDYLVIRVSKESLNSTIKRRRKIYSRLEIALQIDYTPNSIILWKKIKSHISNKVDISGNYILLEGGYEHQDLVADIQHIHNLRMEDVDLE